MRPRNGKRIDQEALRPAHQRKGVAVELAVVQELVARAPLEPRDLEQQLRKVRQRHVIGAEQHHRCARDPVAIDQQAQPAQDLQRLARARVVDPTPADGLLQRQHQLAPVKPGNIPAEGGLVFPALRGVHLFQQQALEGLARHGARGVQHPLVGHAAKGHRHARAAGHGEHQHLAPAVDGHPLDRRKQRRLEALELLREFFERALGDRLANDLARRRNAERHLPALAVGEGAEGSAGTVFLGGGFLELERGRFAGGGQSDDLVGCHRGAASNASARSAGFSRASASHRR